MVGDGGGGWCKAHLFCQPLPLLLAIHHISRATIPILVFLGGFRAITSERYLSGRQQHSSVAATWSQACFFGSSVFFQTTSNSPTSPSTASILHARTLRPAPVCLGQLVCVNRSSISIPARQGKAHLEPWDISSPAIIEQPPTTQQEENDRRNKDRRQTTELLLSPRTTLHLITPRTTLDVPRGPDLAPVSAEPSPDQTGCGCACAGAWV